MVDPPALMRRALRYFMARVIDADQVQKQRDKTEAERQRAGAPHVVEYFHQLDDPYALLTAQVLAELAARYDIELKPHLIRATGGDAQPELEKLAVWARRDAGLNRAPLRPRLSGRSTNGADRSDATARSPHAGRQIARKFCQRSSNDQLGPLVGRR